MSLAIQDKGLSRAREIYQDRTHRAKDLHTQGRKIIGYKDIHPVLEMITALDLVPYRLLGDMSEPITIADAHISAVICPLIRSTLDLGLKGKYDFLDGSVMFHGCDAGQNLASIWRSCMKERHKYYYFLDFPHGTRLSAQKKTKALLVDFKESLESFSGRKLSNAKLKDAIVVHNLQRALVRQLYGLTKPDPPLISGTEIFQVTMSLMSLPVEEGNNLLKQVISEIRERKNDFQKKPRLFIWGSTIDNITLIEMIEDAGANVVMDDTSVGSRFYWPDVELTDDPLDGLVYRYLIGLKSPRTFMETVSEPSRKDYMGDLDNRFRHLKGFVEDWDVEGVILQSVRYCDIHGYEIPALKDYFIHLGLPSIYIEHDYSESSLAPLTTRIQAFLEMLGQGGPQ